MSAAQHVQLFTMAVTMWTAFFAAGLSSNYFMDWPWTARLGLIVVVPTFVLIGIARRRARSLNAIAAKRRALWTAFYFTAPFLALDALYLGLHEGLGATFLASHWHLTAFYLTPWLAVPLMAQAPKVVASK